MQSKQFTPSLSSIFGLTLVIALALIFGSVFPVQAQSGATETPPPPQDSGEAIDIDPNIVGGNPADPGEWPWQVALVSGTSADLYNTQFCGGSLISSQWVVTAAHCVYGNATSNQDVVAGIYNLQSPAPGYQRRDVAQIIIHPNYNPGTSDSDIALLRLSSPVTLGGSGATATAAVPLVPAAIGALVGTNAWVTGWGNTESVPQWPAQLYEVQVPIISNTLCNDINHYAGDITSNMMCAGLEEGGKDSCQGDSGGPLVVNNGGQWQLAGVVSWGTGCAEPQLPGVYTRVSNFVNWINTNTQPPASKLTYRSVAANDGWVLESGEAGEVGGKTNVLNTIFLLGDDVTNQQYRAILSFDTSNLPDNAQIVSVTLKLWYAGVAGTNPFNTHGDILADIRSGMFSDSLSLQATDFEAASDANGVIVFTNSPVRGVYSGLMSESSFSLVNLTGVTQFRLRFALDDNNDFGRDILKIYSGNALTTYRPQLIVKYTVP